MEKVMRTGPESNMPSTSQQLSSMVTDASNGLPEELTVYPPSDSMIENLVDVYFRSLSDSFFSFLHERLFLKRMQEKTIPKAILYAVCAVSARLYHW